MYSSLSQYIHTSLASFSDTISTKTPQVSPDIISLGASINAFEPSRWGYNPRFRPSMDENSVGMDMDGLLGLLGLLG